MREISFKWRNGYIVASLRGGSLVFEARNSAISIDERQIIVRGLYENIREYSGNPRSRFKTIYIDLAFPLEGTEPRGIIYEKPVDTYLGRYGLSYTPLGEAGNYITIYPPEGSLYEYIVLSDDIIMLETVKRRKTYLMREDNEVTIMLL